MSGSRREVPAPERFKVWVRAAGRCTLCGKDLLDDSLTKRVWRLGELAHIVGQLDTAGSPRGLADLNATERDMAQNLMLVCAGEHVEIDRAGATELMTVERLTKLKAEHEGWVHRLTGLEKARGTAVVRVRGDVRGSAVELTKATCAEAVITCEDRFPEFPLAFDEYGIEIDLHGLPGEMAADTGYWQAGMARIDEVLAHKVHEAVRTGRVRHISVFAFARLPLVVYLGARLDDTTPVTIYERHRRSQSWVWPAARSTVRFAVQLPQAPPSGTEAVVIVNVSGTVQTDKIPEPLRGLRRYVVAPVAATPSTEVIDSLAALEAFRAAVRELFATIESFDTGIERLHVLAALPVSAAVTLGRAHTAHVDPRLAIYDRAAVGYTPALEIA